MVKKAETKHSFGDKPWFTFEHVTMVPYCRKLIDTNSLTPAEKKWLNDYNDEVSEKVSPLLQDDFSKSWLESETRHY
jgi:Xaa-Pro aminopeptidase